MVRGTVPPGATKPLNAPCLADEKLISVRRLFSREYLVMRLVFLALIAASCGCSLLRSRYAMDDPVYAEKYKDGAQRGDLLGKAKQALDARHTEGLGGLYFGGGAQVRPNSGNVMGGGELGGESYVTSWITARGALAGYLGEDEGYGGVDLGVRLQTPTRIAPFIGVGTFHGGSRGVEIAHWDGLDNDDGRIDEWGEKRSTIDGWLSTIYPEVGAHLWVDGNWRLTGYGRYLVTTEGRKQDDWLLGLQVTCFGR
jgi:hypothetical protein